MYQTAVWAMFTLSLDALAVLFTEYGLNPDMNTLNADIETLKSKLK